MAPSNVASARIDDCLKEDKKILMLKLIALEKHSKNFLGCS